MAISSRPADVRLFLMRMKPTRPTAVMASQAAYTLARVSQVGRLGYLQINSALWAKWPRLLKKWVVI